MITNLPSIRKSNPISLFIVSFIKNINSNLKSVLMFILFCNVFLIQSSNSFGQEAIQYKIKLIDVDDLSSAKMVTDILRPIFNTPEKPFNVYPTFDDAKDFFIFSSPVDVSKTYLEAVLSDEGIEMISFERSN